MKLCDISPHSMDNNIFSVVTKANLSIEKSSIPVSIDSFSTRETRIPLFPKDILDGLTCWQSKYQVPLIETISCQVPSFKHARGGEVTGTLPIHNDSTPSLPPNLLGSIVKGWCEGLSASSFVPILPSWFWI